MKIAEDSAEVLRSETETTRTEEFDTEKYKMLDREAVLRNKERYWFWRRTQDIILSLFAMIVLLPVFALVAVLIFLDDPHGSPLFIQERVGRDGERFMMYKFRTMVVDAESQLDDLLDANEKDGPVFKIKEDPRITRIGHFLRQTSIDELPQLLNVLKGDMSIVGPRPCIPREVEHYTPFQRQRLFITPGLTCYWQIQPQRDNIKFDDWVNLDLQYIKERSFWVDWKIILKTIVVVMTADGE